MSKIFVTGDLHSYIDFDKLYEFAFREGKNLTKEDYLIICGDFGVIFNYKGMTDREQDLLNWLDGAPWTTLFVDGNHECFPRLAAYDIEKWHGGKVHRIMRSVIHLMRGEVFEIDGRTLFAFGGAQSTDKYWRTEGENWWPEEEPNETEFNNALKNLEKIDFKPDLIITHAAPTDYKKYLYGNDYRSDKTSQMLNSILYYCPNYGKWYCGHYHIDRSVKENFRILYRKIEEVEWEE